MTTTPSTSNRVFPRAARPALLLAGLALAGALSSCALLLGGAVVGGALVVSDRRTPGAQLDDQTIELKAANRAASLFGDRAHVVTTSFNRIVLLTGEVPADADKTAIEQSVAGIENVKSVVNELVAAAPSSLSARSSDTVITSKVKASYIDAKDIFANSIKVVTERGVVYLMGRVTEREATRATEVARGVSGVMKVVKVFEIVSESELADMNRK